MQLEDSHKLKAFQDILDLTSGTVFHLRFGPLDFFLSKTDIELVVKSASSNDGMDSSFHYENPYTGVVPENLLKTERVAFSRAISHLKILPCLSDRSFVAKPRTGFSILPGETTKIFMSTPMSLQVIDAENKQVLSEIPVMHRPMTWFGEDTMIGEVCYFTHINAALSEENLPFRPHRAMTHVNIVNRSKMPIPIERLRIPVPYLNLFQRENGLFVTSSIDIDCDPKGQVRNLKIRAPKTNIKNLTLVSTPRSKANHSFLARSVTELMR